MCTTGQLTLFGDILLWTVSGPMEKERLQGTIQHIQKPKIYGTRVRLASLGQNNIDEHYTIATGHFKNTKGTHNPSNTAHSTFQ